MFLEAKATEIAIGQIRGFVKPSKAERLAAYELFVELSARVTTVSIADERGFLRGTFDDLAAVGDITVEILRKHGCDAAKGRNDGNITLAVVALRVLNEIIAPRLIEWEPKLRDYEGIAHAPGTDRAAVRMGTTVAAAADRHRRPGRDASRDPCVHGHARRDRRHAVAHRPGGAPAAERTHQHRHAAPARRRPTAWTDRGRRWSAGSTRSRHWAPCARTVGSTHTAPGGRPALGESSTPPMIDARRRRRRHLDRLRERPR